MADPMVGDPPVAPPPSFDEFYFKSLGPKPSLLDRLRMAPQTGSSLGDAVKNSPMFAPSSTSVNTSVSSVSPATSAPTTATENTAESSSSLDQNPSPTTPSQVMVAQTIASISQVLSSNQENAVFDPAMDTDERVDPDVIEVPSPPGSRIPHSYRALPNDHYFIAPPTILPYPRSPLFRISENHTLYTPTSLFAHLPRAPPRSPRLDPLAILELEADRERSEWEQERKKLGRPTLDLSTIGRDRLTKAPCIPDSTPAQLDPESDSESSDVELQVYDDVSPIDTRKISILPEVSNASAASGPGSAPHNPPPSNRDSLLPLTPANLASRLSTPTASSTPVAVSRQTKSSLGVDPVAPGPNATLVGAQETGSPEPANTTPAKRKHAAIEDPPEDGPRALQATRKEGRVGVPPPLRASVEPASGPSSSPIAAPAVPPGPAPMFKAPTKAPPSQFALSAPKAKSLALPTPATTTVPATTAAPAVTTTSTPQTGQKPCRFYNRPPGRVCVRKEACSDLHIGPLQKPLAASVLASDGVVSAMQPGVSAADSLSIAPTSATQGKFASGASTSNDPSAPPMSTSTAIPSVATPVVPKATAPPPCVVNTLTTSSGAASLPPRPPAPTPAPAPTSAPHQPTATTGPPNSVNPAIRPPSRSGRSQPAICRFFGRAGGCVRGRACPFRHVTESAPTPSQVETGSSRDSGPQVAQIIATNQQPQARMAMEPSTRTVPATAQVTAIQPTTSSGPPQGSLGPSSTANKVPATPKKPSAPSASKGRVTVKTEQNSPALNPPKKAPVPQVKSRVAPPPASRMVKEEDVTLYDLMEDPLADADIEMVGASGERATGTASGTANVLPVAISILPSTSGPHGLPARPQAQAIPPTVHKQPPKGATTQAPAPVVAASSVPPPPVVSTVVIPPTPVRPPPATGSNAVLAQPAAPVRSSPPRDPSRLDPTERRELLKRMQDPPPRREQQQPRSGSNTHRPAYNSWRASSRSQSPARSRGRSPVSSRGYSPTRSRGYSPPRSRSRSISPGRGWNGTTHRLTRSREYSPRRSVSPRFDSYDRRRIDRRDSSSRSRSPDRYAGRRYPAALSHNARAPPRRPSPRYSRDRWSPARSPRSPPPRSPAEYRRPSYDERDNEYRSTANTRGSTSRNRSPYPPAGSRSNSYNNANTRQYHEDDVTRHREANGHRSPLPPDVVHYQDHSGAGRNVNGARAIEQAGVHDFVGNQQDSNYDPRPDSVFHASAPLVGYTPERPPTMTGARHPTQAIQISRQPMADSDDYDMFEQSMAMDVSSPPLPTDIRYPAPNRLQDRVDAVIERVTSGETNTSLYARMTQENEQPSLVARIASNPKGQSNKANHKGPKSNPPNNTTQLAARLGVNNGERSQPLANRLLSEPQSRSPYQNREPAARPGGGLMARMVGDKKTT